AGKLSKGTAGRSRAIVQAQGHPKARVVLPKTRAKSTTSADRAQHADEPYTASRSIRQDASSIRGVAPIAPIPPIAESHPVLLSARNPTTDYGLPPFVKRSHARSIHQPARSAHARPGCNRDIGATTASRRVLVRRRRPVSRARDARRRLASRHPQRAPPRR